ncbi:Crp/Fnr family transcriptional regulator [uncultured Draconibacterium sp.]|uniref:Crp/Fnr family transcriptional regulator n=1 Tax=uncultured Draconibacterium sp. TaxID=1573823 RepID=UPI002AA7E8B4|nr:Crp/Fnr family transcriptional regulator [uncultured Draconibacterium sp.]
MNLITNTCIDCTLKSGAVSVLDNSELCTLEEGCSKIQYEKGELIFKEGGPVQHIIYIRKGFVKLVKKGVGGKDFILSISKKGSYLGIQNLDESIKTNYFSAITLTKSEVCFIDRHCFSNLLKQNGEFALKVLSTVFSDEMNYFDRLVKNVQQQLPGRLANTISYFSKEVYGKNSFALNLTQTEIAALIGTSRESVSRILKEFQDMGIITLKNNVLTILNEKRLEEIKLKG